jgi:hypothetical protein
MQRCDEVTRALAREELREASWRRRVSVRIHLLMCRACRRYERELEVIGEAARRDAAEEELGAERVDALVRRAMDEPPEDTSA